MFLLTDKSSKTYFIIFMQQVLNLLFQEHRRSLQYPENTVALRYRPAYQQVFQPARRNFLRDKAVYQEEFQSVELKPIRQKKQLEKSRDESNRKKSSKISKQQEKLMKKYFQNHEPLEKQILKLPAVQREVPTRGPRTRGAKSNSSRSQYSERQIPSWEIKRQKLMRNRYIQSRIRTLGWVLVFIKKVKYFIKVAIHRFKMLSDISQKMPQVMHETVFKYYKQTLGRPLSQMGTIVKKKMASKQYHVKTEIVNNILDISQCLKRSSLKQGLLRFLTLITFQYLTLPHDFYSDFELLRLNLMSKKFKLTSINEGQITMIVGIFFGIKLFSNSILSQPEKIPYISLPKKIDLSGSRVIWAYKSYFSLAILKLFESIPIVNKKPQFLKDLRKKGVTPIEIPQQNDEFYIMVKQKYSKQHDIIIRNLSTWINRIAKQIITQRSKSLSK